MFQVTEHLLAFFRFPGLIQNANTRTLASHSQTKLLFHDSIRWEISHELSNSDRGKKGFARLQFKMTIDFCRKKYQKQLVE